MVGKATSPDGRQWKIGVRRVRFPSWPRSDYDTWETGDPISIVISLLLAPFFWLLIPLARVLLELPLAVGRGLFSPTRWVEARSVWPSEMSLVWRTSDEHSREVVEKILEELPKGYGSLGDIDGAVFESMTEPPGVHDLDA